MPGHAVHPQAVYPLEVGYRPLGGGAVAAVNLDDIAQVHQGLLHQPHAVPLVAPAQGGVGGLGSGADGT